MRRLLVLAGIVVAGCGGGDPGVKRVEILFALGPTPKGIDPAQPPPPMLDGALLRALYMDRNLAVPPAPDLADGPPRISDGGRTVTVRLKRGVRFAPPVNREMVAGDVRYAISRVFMKTVGGEPGAFADLEGVEAFRSGRAKEISGISTPDRHTLQFRLKTPTGFTFAGGLVSRATVPVPPEWARRFDAKAPSTYGQHMVSVSPYMLEHDRTGRAIVRRNRLRVLRNPNWDPKLDVRPAHLDEIVMHGGFSDPAVIARRIVRGRRLAYWGPLSPAALAQARGERAKLLESSRASATAAMAINTTIPPLDDINVRRAILAAFDRRAVLGAFGGRGHGDVATHYLKPGVPGFEAAGGLVGTGVDYLREPSGDLALARAYMRRAGYPSGRYTGSARLRFVGFRGSFRAITDVMRAQVEKLGFRLRVTELDPFQAIAECAKVKTRAAFCWIELYWLQRDPQSQLERFFHGRHIVRDAENRNLSQLDDPRVNAAMDEAAGITGPDRRAQAWGEIDRMLVDLAPVVPMIWEAVPSLRSPDLKPLVSDFTRWHDPCWWDVT